MLLPYVEVYGGFAGTERSADERTPDALAGTEHQTFLSGDLDHDDNAYHVVVIPEAAKGSVLDGFAITGGYANGDGDITV